MHKIKPIYIWNPRLYAVNSDLLRQYGISVILAWTSLLWKKPLQKGQGACRKRVYLQATVFLASTKINYTDYIFSKTESTVILKLSGERNNQSEFSPKYDQYSTYICTVRRREITVHYFTDFSQRWKLSNVCSPSVQLYKQFPKTCVHVLMHFLHADFTHVVLV